MISIGSLCKIRSESVVLNHDSQSMVKPTLDMLVLKKKMGFKLIPVLNFDRLELLNTCMHLISYTLIVILEPKLMNFMMWEVGFQ
jgi:hypothetical protein